MQQVQAIVQAILLFGPYILVDSTVIKVSVMRKDVMCNLLQVSMGES